MADVRTQAVTGVVPPDLAEARIREVWPAVTRWPAVATLGRVLTRSIIFAPVAWLLMAPFYFLKILPGFATRYTLTNRRLMIRRGLRPSPSREVALAKIDEVRVRPDANSNFFRAADLDVLTQGQVVLTLPGVPEPESFRHNVIQACKAWVPGRADGPIVPAKAT
jgi:hypothetical protein